MALVRAWQWIATLLAMASVGSADLHLRGGRSRSSRILENLDQASGHGQREEYACGKVPLEALVEEWPSLEHVRCPRGQDGDQQAGEKNDPSELEFLGCALLSTSKFVVWTPHALLRASPDVAKLLVWAQEHTTCDFSIVERCPDGWKLVKGNEASQLPSLKLKGRCQPTFDITSQPVGGQVLPKAALELFEATADDQAVGDLSVKETDMAFGAILGYPMFSTRAYMRSPPGFETGYRRAVTWLLQWLPPSSSVYNELAAWPDRTAEPDGIVELDRAPPVGPSLGSFPQGMHF